MMRTLLVVVTAALLCLSLTGLRVVLLERLAKPPDTLVAPRPVEESEPPRTDPPVESIAGTGHDAGPSRAARMEPSAMIWGTSSPRRAPF